MPPAKPERKPGETKNDFVARFENDVPADPTVLMAPEEAAEVRAEMAAEVRAAGADGTQVPEAFWAARGFDIWSAARQAAADRAEAERREEERARAEAQRRDDAVPVTQGEFRALVECVRDLDAEVGETIVAVARLEAR